MKKEELMIGDLIEFGEEPLKVQFNYNDGYDDIIAERIVEYVDYNDGPYEQTEDIQLIYCSPIPITDEILKANGFVREGGTSWNRKYNVNVQHWSKDNMVLNGTGKHGNPINIPDIVYVHELQHALRICNLNELADNFVIEKKNNNGN